MFSTVQSMCNYLKGKKTITIVSGFWDPLGKQHILLFNEAKKIGDYLIVGTNSDECGLMKKKQACFMPLNDRMEICLNIKSVDEVMSFKDSDGTACQLIQKIYDKYETEVESGLVELVFCNGGDRSSGLNTPEQKYVDKYLNGKVKMIYGVGGYNKYASSSEYLRDWVNNTMKRYDIDFQLTKKY